MVDYTLYYWPIPFRGQFVRSLLAHVHASWEEADDEALRARWRADPKAQPVPFMGLPVLTDHAAELSLSQMPAVLTYLGRKHDLLPRDLEKEALTAKVIADASDVLYETTRYHGEQLWTAEAWEAFQPRLARWMAIFGETGRRHGLTAQEGFFLGTPTLGLADLTVAELWGTMTARFPSLRPVLERNAPAVAGLMDRVRALPIQVELRRCTDEGYGEVWCGGEIEASLRAVVT
ncbi:MAG: glutathione S-transferase [Pseudomonadota bacterium]